MHHVPHGGWRRPVHVASVALGRGQVRVWVRAKEAVELRVEAVDVLLGLVEHRNVRVIVELAANARSILDDRDVELAQVFRRTDAGESINSLGVSRAPAQSTICRVALARFS